jgi:hypothetical protein
VVIDISSNLIFRLSQNVLEFMQTASCRLKISRNLTKTWRYSASITDPAVEYAWIRAGGRNIADCCPEDLCNELQATQRKMKAYLKSFKIAKVNMADHCVFD